MAIASLKSFLGEKKIKNTFAKIEIMPTKFEGRFLEPDFDPLFRSSPKHHAYCGKLSKQIKANSKVVCFETPNGLNVIALTPANDVIHFCLEENQILTWSLMDAMRRRGIDVNRANISTLEIGLPEKLDLNTKNSILIFLAVARALGKAKHFGLASIKRDPTRFARRLSTDASKIFSNEK